MFRSPLNTRQLVLSVVALGFWQAPVDAAGPEAKAWIRGRWARVVEDRPDGSQLYAQVVFSGGSFSLTVTNYDAFGRARVVQRQAGRFTYDAGTDALVMLSSSRYSRARLWFNGVNRFTLDDGSYPVTWYRRN